MIIVLLMLTSALAGWSVLETTDLEQQIADLQQSNDEKSETINQQKEDIADAETYRDSLLVLLEGSNTSNGELESMIETANNTILTLQSDLAVQQDLVAEWIDRAINYDFSGANLSGVDLSNAHLFDVDLSGANLSGANLYEADLRFSGLDYADLSGADLVGAALRYADLSGADLSGANLYGADLYNAFLSGADLTGANLFIANLDDVNWYNTTCPDGTNSDNNGNTCENNLWESGE